MYSSFLDELAEDLAYGLAESWDTWRGDCQCGRLDAVGFCDRCVDCAIDSVYANELEFSGTTEAFGDMVKKYEIGETHPRVTDYVVGKALETQAEIWRYMAKFYANQGKGK